MAKNWTLFADRTTPSLDHRQCTRGLRLLVARCHPRVRHDDWPTG